MKKQTAIQELVEIFEEMRSPFYNGSTIDVALAISLMKSMLEKEKEQMCEFADEFAIECINFHHEKTMSTERFFELEYGGNL